MLLRSCPWGKYKEAIELSGTSVSKSVYDNANLEDIHKIVTFLARNVSGNSRQTDMELNNLMTYINIENSLLHIIQVYYVNIFS